jgi:hypothetical protein
MMQTGCERKFRTNSVLLRAQGYSKFGQTLRVLSIHPIVSAGSMHATGLCTNSVHLNTTKMIV